MRRATAASFAKGASPVTYALLGAFGVEHEWRADNSAVYTLDGNTPTDRYSALEDNGAVGGWTLAQATGANRPDLAAGPSAQFSSSKWLENANALDPTSTFTMGMVVDASANTTSGIFASLAISAPAGAQRRFMLGVAGAYPYCIFRRYNDALTLTQCLVSQAVGILYLIGKMVVTAGPTLTMSLSVNGANFADPKALSGTFTNTGLRTYAGRTNTASGPLETSDDAFKFGFVTQADTSNSDAAGMYTALHAVYG